MTRHLLSILLIGVCTDAVSGLSSASKPAQSRTEYVLSFDGARLFKPRLVPKNNWDRTVSAFREGYALRCALADDASSEESCLIIELHTKPGCEERIYGVNGFAALALPSALKPRPDSVGVQFFYGKDDVAGVAFPQFEAILKAVLAEAAPGDLADWVEKAMRITGVGKVDTDVKGTLFQQPKTHTLVSALWETQRRDGDWVSATCLRIRVPLGVPVQSARKALQRHGLSICMAIKPSVATRRVCFLMDRPILAGSEAEVSVGTLSVSEITAVFDKLGQDGIAAKYPRKEEYSYLVEGKLELVDLGSFKMYGLRQGKNAILAFQAKQADWAYPSLRANVGKQIVVGTRDFGCSFFYKAAWARSLAGKGYHAEGQRVLGTGWLLFHGVEPAEESKMREDYEAFLKLVKTAGLAKKATTQPLVDVASLPKADLKMVVVTPLTGIFSLSTRTLEIKIEGPVVKTFKRKAVATATPVSVTFSDIPQGTYTVTATYGSRKLQAKAKTGEGLVTLTMN